MTIDSKSLDWRRIDLHGSVAISRLCGEYVIHDFLRVPGTKYRIKVFEREADFFALPNIAFRSADGSVDSTCGLGATELEALQDALAGVGALLASRPSWSESDLEWIDPRDF
jgi:hypothetical protein